MTELINKKTLLSFFERESDRWMQESDRIINEVVSMRIRGIPDTSVALQRLAIDGLKAVDRAYVMERLYDAISSWDGNNNLGELNLSKIDRMADIDAAIRHIGETIGADDEVTERMIERMIGIMQKVVNE